MSATGLHLREAWPASRVGMGRRPARRSVWDGGTLIGEIDASADYAPRHLRIVRIPSWMDGQHVGVMDETGTAYRLSLPTREAVA